MPGVFERLLLERIGLAALWGDVPIGVIKYPDLAGNLRQGMA
jgi:hypothetical protein